MPECCSSKSSHLSWRWIDCKVLHKLCYFLFSTYVFCGCFLFITLVFFFVYCLLFILLLLPYVIVNKDYQKTRQFKTRCKGDKSSIKNSTDQGRRSWGLGVLTPWKYVGGVRVCFDPLKKSHSFIQICCCTGITASFTASMMNSWTLSFQAYSKQHRSLLPERNALAALAYLSHLSQF